MMRYISCLILTVAVMLGLSGCGSVKSVKSYRPDEVRLELQMSDLKFVGETEVEITYRTYLGFITSVDKVNGVDYDGTDKSVASIGGVHGHLKKACYKVVEEYPNARYFQLVRKTKTSDRLFLGSHVTEKAIIRAYEIR